MTCASFSSPGEPADRFAASASAFWSELRAFRGTQAMTVPAALSRWESRAVACGEARWIETTRDGNRTMSCARARTGTSLFGMSIASASPVYGARCKLDDGSRRAVMTPRRSRLLRLEVGPEWLASPSHLRTGIATRYRQSGNPRCRERLPSGPAEISRGRNNSRENDFEIGTLRGAVRREPEAAQPGERPKGLRVSLFADSDAIAR